MNSNLVKNLSIGFSLLFIQYITYWLLKRNTWFTSTGYPNFYPYLQAKYSLITNWIGFSLGDFLYLFLIAVIFYCIYKLINSLIYQHTVKNLLIVFNILLIALNLLYFTFHWFWGFNYYKPSIFDSETESAIQLEELKEIANYSLKEAIQLRQDLPEDDTGTLLYNSSEFSLPDSMDILDINLKFAPKDFKPKFSLFSPIMRYFGVSGYYNPFTAEAQIIKGIPKVSMPFTQCHESAHFLGYAAEYEANFIGYILGTQSSHKSLKYSSHYKALQYLLREIHRFDTAFYDSMLSNYSIGMKRDRAQQIKYHHLYSGTTSDIFGELNNQYLKANSQDEGVESYNKFVDYLIYYYKSSSTSKEDLSLNN